MLSEGGVVVEGDRLAQARVDPCEDGEHDRYRLGGGFPHQARGQGDPGLALVQDQYRPCVLADDQVTLPMADLVAVLNGCGPVVD